VAHVSARFLAFASTLRPYQGLTRRIDQIREGLRCTEPGKKSRGKLLPIRVFPWVDGLETVKNLSSRTLLKHTFHLDSRKRSKIHAPIDIPNLELPDPISPANGNPQSLWYGTVLYYLSFALAGLYLLWAFLPEHALEALGVSWYPKRFVLALETR
jgi:hypothetical protein